MEKERFSPLSLTQERTDKRSVSDLSLRSSQCSLVSPNIDEFYEICRSQLKVSPRNTILQIKLNGYSEIISQSVSNDQMDEMVKKQLEERRKLKELEINEEIQNQEIFSSKSPDFLMFFLVPDKHLRYLVPDFEKFTCRQLFESRPCHESFFGLSRLLAFEAKFHTALEYMNKAVLKENSEFYRLWHCLLKVKIGRITEVKTNDSGFFQSFLCWTTVKRKAGVIEELERIPGSVEAQWALFEISQKGCSELDNPEYFASTLKDIDAYYGYLAWSQIFIYRNDSVNSMNLLKDLIGKYRERPEAYIKLWNYLYYTRKDYTQAEDLCQEMLLKVNPQLNFQYYILCCIYTAKVYYKQKKYKECFGFLQRKFIEHPTYPVFLFEYGRLGTKSEDHRYSGSSLTALQESLKLSDTPNKGLIYYWLTKAYMQSRLPTDAFDSAKLAIDFLDRRRSSKISELKALIKDLQPNMIKIQTCEALLDSDFAKDSFDKCKKLCNDLQSFNTLTADVLYSKALWKVGKPEEALNKLYSLSGLSTAKMTGYLTLIECLEKQDNLKCMKTVACEMINKCRNPSVPSSDWVKANLVYTKILIKMKKPGKAILLLKALAKLLPPFPFADIQYTKALQRAKTIHDLTEACTSSIESYAGYSFTTYKNSFIDSIKDPREFSRKLYEEEEKLDERSSKKFNARRTNRLSTEKIDGVGGLYRKKPELTIETKKNSMPDIKLSDMTDIMLFSVSSDTTFLYKIAKISMRYGVLFRDGLCAITDYIELQKFEKPSDLKTSRSLKAFKLQSFLLSKLNSE